MCAHLPCLQILLFEREYRVLTLPQYWLFLFSAPVMITIGLGLLWREVGVAAIPGVALMIMFTVVSGYFGSRIMEIRKKSLAAADLRIRIISEIVQAIKLVKMLGWQQQIVSSVKSARATETASLVSLAMIKALNITVSFVSSLLIIAATFSVYIATDDVLVSAKAFTVLSLFNVLRFPLIMLPMTLKFVGECWVAFQRIEGFLEQQEAEEDPHLTAHNCGDDNALVVRDCVMSWDGNVPTLQGMPDKAPHAQATSSSGMYQPGSVPSAHVADDYVDTNAADPLSSTPTELSVNSSDIGSNRASSTPSACHASSHAISPSHLKHGPQDSSSQAHSSSSDKLHGISLSIAKGSFLSVVGAVGAGLCHPLSRPRICMSTFVACNSFVKLFHYLMRVCQARAPFFAL
jgi:ABC-type multidrug transport system fused ATPase/permease subunit